ncbi:hypothetical protein SPFM14_00108 [Salmonella phage SPFM14]|nr:hypothetical protein SPFM14_00108 [Salmonella phage SPFM14]
MLLVPGASEIRGRSVTLADLKRLNERHKLVSFLLTKVDLTKEEAEAVMQHLVQTRYGDYPATEADLSSVWYALTDDFEITKRIRKPCITRLADMMAYSYKFVWDKKRTETYFDTEPYIDIEGYKELGWWSPDYLGSFPYYFVLVPADDLELMFTPFDELEAKPMARRRGVLVDGKYFFSEGILNNSVFKIRDMVAEAIVIFNGDGNSWPKVRGRFLTDKKNYTVENTDSVRAHLADKVRLIAQIPGENDLHLAYKTTFNHPLHLSSPEAVAVERGIDNRKRSEY